MIPQDISRSNLLSALSQLTNRVPLSRLDHQRTIFYLGEVWR